MSFDQNFAPVNRSFLPWTLSLLALLALVPRSQADNCLEPPPGLISWWRGENNGDSRIGTNNAFVQNGTAFVPGQVKQAFSFDGIDDHLRIPYSPSLTTSNLSVELWIKPTALVAAQDLIFGQPFGSPQLQVKRGISGVVVSWQLRITNGPLREAVSSREIPLNTFTHVAGTWDGSNLRLYINGALDGQQSVSGQGLANTCDYFIGGFFQACGFSGQFFHGVLDEISIYNRALTAGEVGGIFQAGTAGKCVCIQSPPGLIGWWSGDLNGVDRVASNDASLINGASFAHATVNDGFSFDGVNDSLHILYSPTLTSSNLSVELWVNPTAPVSDPAGQDLLFGQAFGSPQMAIKPGIGGAIVSWQSRITNGTLREAVSSNAIPLNTFSHVVGTWDGASLRLYVNGVFHSAQLVDGPTLNTTCDFYIGGFTEACGVSGSFFQGIIDEVSVYNRALTPADIAQLYQADGGGKCVPSTIAVYDNTNRFRNERYSATVEFGDEIVLAGTARTITNFSFEYYGTNFSGNEQIRVRLYQNDGPDIVPGAFSPQTVLYDSGFASIAATVGSVLTFTGLNVVVPDSFTWAVTFSGISANEDAGLKIYSPPWIGKNYPDYWEHAATGWQLRERNDGKAMDFAARFEAVRPAEPVVVAQGLQILSIEFRPNAPPPPATNRVVLTWQSVPGLSYSVDTSTNLVNWTTAGTNILAASSTVTWTNIAVGSRRFFRIHTP